MQMISLNFRYVLYLANSVIKDTYIYTHAHARVYTHTSLSFNEVCCSKETLNNHYFLLRNTFSCSLAYEWLNRVKTEMAKSHLCFLDKICIPESYEVHHDFGSNIGIWDPLQPKCNSLISTTLVSRYGDECYHM